MGFNLLNIDVSTDKYVSWFWITLLNITWGDQDRSLLHIEYNGGTWKFQILWTKNDCWAF